MNDTATLLNLRPNVPGNGRNALSAASPLTYRHGAVPYRLKAFFHISGLQVVQELNDVKRDLRAARELAEKRAIELAGGWAGVRGGDPGPRGVPSVLAITPLSLRAAFVWARHCLPAFCMLRAPPGLST